MKRFLRSDKFNDHWTKTAEEDAMENSCGTALARLRVRQILNMWGCSHKNTLIHVAFCVGGCGEEGDGKRSISGTYSIIIHVACEHCHTTACEARTNSRVIPLVTDIHLYRLPKLQ